MSGGGAAAGRFPGAAGPEPAFRGAGEPRDDWAWWGAAACPAGGAPPGVTGPGGGVGPSPGGGIPG